MSPPPGPKKLGLGRHGHAAHPAHGRQVQRGVLVPIGQQSQHSRAPYPLGAPWGIAWQPKSSLKLSQRLGLSSALTPSSVLLGDLAPPWGSVPQQHSGGASHPTQGHAWEDPAVPPQPLESACAMSAVTITSCQAPIWELLP